MHVIIIGSGPAGVSAALYARRGGADVTVVTKGAGALRAAELVENYYGFDVPITGAELERRSIAGAKRLGVVFAMDEAMSVLPTDDGQGFRVEGGRSAYEGDTVILAAGASRSMLSVPGLQEFEGRGVSFCAICDAFFYRGKNVAVIGAGDYALHEAEIHRQTLIAYAPTSEQAQYYVRLAQAIDTNEMLTVPTPMAFEELEELVESYGD